tara:strand:- start:3784 stop:4374 length:591 start_codon:yes stop_codon:yes gene_type:complete
MLIFGFLGFLNNVKEESPHMQSFVSFLLEEENKTCYGRFCDALQQAETGGEKQKFIRTKHAPKSGSSAFGPMQITGTTLQDMAKRHPENFPDQKYTQSLIDQSKLFLKYGKEKDKPGYDPKYDYGGAGDPALHDPKKYRQVGMGVVKGMAQDIFKGVPDNLSKEQTERLVQRYRGATRKQDPRYYAEFDKIYYGQK